MCTQNLKNWTGSDTYTLSVVVTDGVHTDGPEDLQITIQHTRKPPWFQNLPTTLTLNEDVQNGTEVYIVSLFSNLEILRPYQTFF